MKHLAAISALLTLAVVASCSSGSEPAGGGGITEPPSGLPDAALPVVTADGGLPGHQFPLTLNPLSQPQTSTASISLYFSVVDATGKGVADLAPNDATAKKNFVALEDGLAVDPLESDFTATLLTGQSVTIPTVLLLDLSGSVVQGGALETMKKAAREIIKTLLPEQTLSLYTFADSATMRADFTADKAVLNTAIDGITGADGLSTDLYGSLSTVLTKWQDGLDNTQSVPRVTAGLAIVITDGADTAGKAKLTDLITQRGNKRIVSIGVGAADLRALQQIGNAGFVKPTSFGDLEATLGQITSNLATWNHSIYQATYCSPKRAGQHELRFTVRGNETAAAATCAPAVFSSNTVCTTPGFTQLCGSASTGCCPSDAPFACVGTGHCLKTAQAAAAECGAACVACGGTGQPGAAGTVRGGPAIVVPFAATSYKSTQCAMFRGPACKALDTCCTTVPPQLASTCTAQGLGGDEAPCASASTNYCPALSAQCAKLVQCSMTFGTFNRTSLWQQAHSGDVSACTSILAQDCENIGPQCAALRASCVGKAEPARSACENQYASARSAGVESVREQACQNALSP